MQTPLPVNSRLAFNLAAVGITAKRFWSCLWRCKSVAETRVVLFISLSFLSLKCFRDLYQPRFSIYSKFYNGFEILRVRATFLSALLIRARASSLNVTAGSASVSIGVLLIGKKALNIQFNAFLFYAFLP